MLQVEAVELLADLEEEDAEDQHRDENIERAGRSDFAWADVVFVSGMHIQFPQIRDIQRRAKSCGKLTVLGGSAVSSSPETYPEFDYLHIGEIGDARSEHFAPGQKLQRFRIGRRFGLNEHGLFLPAAG